MGGLDVEVAGGADGLAGGGVDDDEREFGAGILGGEGALDEGAHGGEVVCAAVGGRDVLPDGGAGGGAGEGLGVVEGEGFEAGDAAGEGEGDGLEGGMGRGRHGRLLPRMRCVAATMERVECGRCSLR